MECSVNCRKLLSETMKKLEKLQVENKRLKQEIFKISTEKGLISEELKELKEGIEGVYNNMISLETINKYEEDKEIEVI